MKDENGRPQRKVNRPKVPERFAWSSGGTDKRQTKDNQCTAMSKSTGKQCTKKTNHPTGKCRYHGGVNNRPDVISKKNKESLKGNKNGLKHGGRESIWHDVLDDDEIEFAKEVKKLNVLTLINEEIALITIRERRMMQRIKVFRDKYNEEGFTTVKIETERGTSSSKFKRTNTIKEEQAGVLGQIQDIEEALTKVQDKKAKLIDLKHTIEKGEGPTDTSGVDKFLASLNGAAKRLKEKRAEEKQA